MDPGNGAQFSGSFLSPLLISLAGVVAISLALIVYHWLLVKYCLRHPDQADDVAVSGGVEHKILETIPILPFTGENVKELGTGQTECVICLGEIKEGEAVRLLPNCRHLFHVPCIDSWFLAHSCCPVCRKHVAVTAGIGGERIRDVARKMGHGAALTSEVQSNVLLRHCVSLVFTRKNKSEDLTTGMKRSLSMDQFHMYLIDESGTGEPSSSSSSTWNMILTNSDSYKAQSKRQLNRMSSSVLRSFSQLHIGRRSASYGILPY
ncbi:hypothetical protein V6N13_110564 [Hibiscus sabdariffa]|uniref:RING-type domain-containing protein n=1 Tax=Hibiscus sabdariffa TaxID=183260 RepID=A0ABR2THM0_9ROSI